MDWAESEEKWSLNTPGDRSDVEMDPKDIQMKELSEPPEYEDEYYHPESDCDVETCESCGHC